jgi:hypothetical protein
MGKVAIRIVGSLFLLWGIIETIEFFWTGNQPTGPLEINVFGYSIGGFIFVFILLGTGFSIIKFKNSGRIWGLVILWLCFLPSFVGLIIFVIYLLNPALDPQTGLGWRIDFKGAEYGLGQDYTITNPWFLFAFSVLFTVIFGLQIYILSSKKNKAYFIVENNTGS